MLITDFELRRNLTEAFKAGKYLITITKINRAEKGKKLKGNTLEHYAKTVQFPRADIMPSLERLAEMLTEESDAQEDNS